MTTPTHACPGCKVDGVKQTEFACRRCWFRLPKPLRDALWDAYRRGSVTAHSEAMAACTRWYEDHPR